MTRERDVKLGDIDEVNVDEPRRRPTGEPRPPRGGGGGHGGGGERPTPRRSAPPARRDGGGSGGWIILTLVLAVTLALACTYFYREISRLQGQMESSMGMSSEQLENLQARLSATDESLDQSSGELRDTLSELSKAIDTNGSEIRKLWDVSNKRNKGWIEENRKQIKANEDAVTALEKTTAGYDQSIKQARDRLAELQKQVDSAVRAVNDSSSQWRTQINQLETQVDVVVDTVRQLEQQNQTQKQALARLQNNQAGTDQLNQRLSDIEDAITAFDQYRLQVNNRLDRLER